MDSESKNNMQCQGGFNMLTDYFKCKECGQVWRITILKVGEINEMNCCPSCGESNFDYAPDDDVMKFD